MKVLHEAKLFNTTNLSNPDTYVPGYGLPPDDFVVSRNVDGSVASVFGDSVWLMAAYHPEGKARNLYFTYWKNERVSEIPDPHGTDVRWAMFVLMWLRNGPALSVRSLYGYLLVVLMLANAADELGLRLVEIVNDHQALIDLLEQKKSGSFAENLACLLSHFSKIDRQHLGFDVVGSKTLDHIRKLSNLRRAEEKQHPPIPTRLYSEILQRLLQGLAEWKVVSKQVLPLVVKCGMDPQFGRNAENQREIAKQLNIPYLRQDFFAEAAGSDVLAFMRSKDHLLDVKGLSRLVREIQLLAKLVIQAFSGMRDDEVTSLRFDCLETLVSNSKSHFVILGRTTKLNNGLAKQTRWVTSQEGANAILLAQEIADSIYSVALEKNIYKEPQFRQLFVSISYLGLTGGKVREVEPLQANSLILSHMKELRARIQPIIHENDIQELEQIDPHRSWRTEDKFSIGSSWHLTSHQFRRSLALYAQRSGLVSLPSLRRQLQHITDEMSRYYAKGSSFANNFIGDDKIHFGNEWQEAQHESSALSYILNVMLSEDVLFGGHANWVEHRSGSSENFTLLNREETMMRFKRGELAYKETLLGGCTKVGPCDKPALNLLNVDCLREGCSNMVGNMKKLERVIAAQDRFVLSLDKSSVEYRTEKSDLDMLVATQKKVLQLKDGNN